MKIKLSSSIHVAWVIIKFLPVTESLFTTSVVV